MASSIELRTIGLKFFSPIGRVSCLWDAEGERGSNSGMSWSGQIFGTGYS